MALTAKFLHSRPQHEIAFLLKEYFARCATAAVVAGFVTTDGVNALDIATSQHAPKLGRLVIGAGTYQAFEAVDRVLSAGTPQAGVRIHLGHSRSTRGKKNPFERYHPMLHRKIYLFEMGDGSAAAFVGSHNMTGFALRGLNGEAGVLLEGPGSDPAFAEIRRHIDEAYAQAVPYDPSMKEAYAWWTREYIDGLKAEANDSPKDAEPTRTIVVLAAASSGSLPVAGDIIFFEIAEALSEIQSLGTPVHVHIFNALAPSPSEALTRLPEATLSLSCVTEGLEKGRGGLELDANWSIDNRRVPRLDPTTRPFRPATSRGMQQVRVRVTGPEATRFEYLFDSGRHNWTPDFDPNDARGDASGGRWHRVRGLSEGGSDGAEWRQLRLLEVTPDSGSFILYSKRRRNLGLLSEVRSIPHDDQASLLDDETQE